MSEHTTYKCDICGAEKRAANHWWLATRGNHGAITILPWSVVIAGIDVPVLRTGEQADAHLCGEQHVLEWISKNLR